MGAKTKDNSSLGLNASSPLELPVLARHIIEVGRNPKVTPNDLTDFIVHIDGSYIQVRQALDLINFGDNRTRLNKAVGLVRPDNFHVAVAMTVAAMNLDRTLSPKSSVSRYAKLNRQREEERNSKQRVVSVIAALLQEFVAFDIISLQEVNNRFGEEVAKLIDQISRITHLPITIRDPASDGTMTLADYKFNQKQHELGQELIYASEDPARVGLIKIAHALQELRCMDKIEDESLKRQIALHIRGLYLPIVQEIGLRDIQYEMQDHLLRHLDPEAHMAIGQWLHKIAAHDMINPLIGVMRQFLERSEYGLESIERMVGRVKEPYAIWRKLLEKDVESAEKSGDEIPRCKVTRLGSFDFGQIHDVIGIRIVLRDSFDENGVPSKKFNHRRIKALNRLMANGPKKAPAYVASPPFKEVPTRCKDYIKLPKQNGYTALHNTYTYGDKLEFETQIVTVSMDIANGNGETRHAIHKERPSQGKIYANDEGGVVRTATATSSMPSIVYHPERHDVYLGLERLESIMDILRRIRKDVNDLSQDHARAAHGIVVSTKGGVLRLLKPEATLRDLATAVHSKLLNDACGAIINNTRYEADAFQTILDQPLVHASFVEILKYPEPAPVKSSGPKGTENAVL